LLLLLLLGNQCILADQSQYRVILQTTTRKAFVVSKVTIDGLTSDHSCGDTGDLVGLINGRVDARIRRIKLGKTRGISIHASCFDALSSSHGFTLDMIDCFDLCESARTNGILASGTNSTYTCYGE